MADTEKENYEIYNHGNILLLYMKFVNLKEMVLLNKKSFFLKLNVKSIAQNQVSLLYIHILFLHTLE